MLTTTKIMAGTFSVQWNNQPTEFYIINVDRGCSGNGRNTYGIENIFTSSIRLVGTLAQAKKSLILTFKQRGLLYNDDDLRN